MKKTIITLLPIFVLGSSFALAAENHNWTTKFIDNYGESTLPIYPEWCWETPADISPALAERVRRHCGSVSISGDDGSSKNNSNDDSDDDSNDDSDDDSNDDSDDDSNDDSNDDYDDDGKPGWGHGDKNHNHSGPPGLNK